MNLPNLNGHVNIRVMVTYKRTFFGGSYGEKRETHETRRLGFWDGEKFHIPPGWQHFTFLSSGDTCLLPDGWGGDHLTPDQIISWTLATDKDERPIQYSNRI